MKPGISCLLASVLLATLSLTGCALGPTPPGDGKPVVRAGEAVIDITPEVGYRMAGYFDERISTGIHDRLKARALVLQQGEQKFVLVSCDVVGVPMTVSKPAREQAALKTGVPVSNIMVCGTHSHTGPLYSDLRNTYFHEAAIAKHGFDEHQPWDYGKFLAEQLEKVIQQANGRLRPANLAVGVGQREGISFNRRYYMRNGTVRFNPGRQNPEIVGPAGPIDPEVGILTVRDLRGRPVAGLTIFAMHPDTVGGTLFGGDYPYYVEESLQQAFGAKYVSLFGLGTCGNINHIDVSKPESVKGQEAAKQFGGALAQSVLDEVEKLPAIKQPSFAVLSKTMTASLQEVTPAQVEDARTKLPLIGTDQLGFSDKVKAVKALDLAARGKECPMEIQVFRFDPETALVCLPGELFVEFGLEIKKNSPFKRTLVMTVCNDRPSYVPTRKAFSEGSYEISNARVKPGTGEQMVQTALELLNQLKVQP